MRCIEKKAHIRHIFYDYCMTLRMIVVNDFSYLPKVVVSNGPLKFLSARKNRPLLDLFAKFRRSSLACARRIFEIAHKLEFLLKFSRLFEIL